MDFKRVLVVAVALVVGLILVSSSCDAFLGAGISLDKTFGHTIDFNLGKNIAIPGMGNVLAGMNVVVDWGVDYDLNALAGYPYGYGGVGSVTQGNLGYNLGVSIDAIQGAALDGSGYGVPVAQQGITTTHLGENIAQQANINDIQVASPFGV
jgi:hypothetical protein